MSWNDLLQMVIGIQTMDLAYFRFAKYFLLYDGKSDSLQRITKALR